MSIVTLPEAKLHLRVTDAAEDALIAVYITAAEQSAVSVLDRNVYADGTALASAITAAPGIFAAAGITYDNAIDAANLLTESADRAEALRVASVNYLRASIVSRQTQDGIVANEAIKAAVLLMIGHLYSNREDVVSGISVAKLPNGAEWLLQPYKAYH